MTLRDLIAKTSGIEQGLIAALTAGILNTGYPSDFNGTHLCDLQILLTSDVCELYADTPPKEGFAWCPEFIDVSDQSGRYEVKQLFQIDKRFLPPASVGDPVGNWVKWMGTAIAVEVSNLYAPLNPSMVMFMAGTPTLEQQPDNEILATLKFDWAFRLAQPITEAQ